MSSLCCIDHDCRLVCLKILEIVPSMAFYVCKVASGVTKLDVTARSFGEESLLFSHVLSFSPPNAFGLSYSLKSVTELETFSYPFMQLLGQRKVERDMQLYFRDIELLLLYRSR